MRRVVHDVCDAAATRGRDPDALELRAVVTRLTPALSGDTGSWAITSPVAVKPTMSIRCPFVRVAGAVELVGRNDSDDGSAGCRRAMNRSASANDRSRVTKASRPYVAAYAVLNGQLPVPS